MKRRTYPESTKATARRLRREGLSISLVAREMGIPRATVGKWLRGEGETRILKVCWCGERFYAASDKARSCSHAHSIKRYKTFGPLKDAA